MSAEPADSTDYAAAELRIAQRLIGAGLTCNSDDPEYAEMLPVSVLQIAKVALDVTVPAVMPMGVLVGTCRDCYTWNGPRGSAHDPAKCPQRKSSIARARVEADAVRQRLADLTGEPA